MNNRLPVITVDLGTYGVHEIDFNDYLNITSDYVTELHEDAARYAWLESVENKLRQQIKSKSLEFDALKGKITSEINVRMTKDLGKSPTVKVLEAEVAADDTLVTFQEQLNEMESQVGLVNKQIGALRMRHSNLKKLVELTIAGHVMGNVNVKEQKEELEVVRESPAREKTEGKGTRRSRNKKEGDN